jgi:hypothetical protein
MSYEHEVERTKFFSSAHDLKEHLINFSRKAVGMSGDTSQPLGLRKDACEAAQISLSLILALNNFT